MDVDYQAILNRGDTLDMFFEGKVVRLRKAGKRGYYDFYVFREYKTRMPYRKGEYAFVEPGFMDKYPELPSKRCGTKVDRPEYGVFLRNNIGAGAVFYRVEEEGMIDSSEIPLVRKKRTSGLEKRLWERLDCPECEDIYFSTLYCHENGQKVMANDWYICDGRTIQVLEKPNTNCYYITERGFCNADNGLFRINPRTLQFERLLPEHFIKDNNLSANEYYFEKNRVITVKEVGNKSTLVSVNPEDGTILDLFPLSWSLVHPYVCVCGKAFYAEGDVIRAVDVVSGQEVMSITVSDYDKWMVLGVNNAGIVSLAKMKLDVRSQFSMSAEIDFARISPGIYDIEKYNAGHLSIDETNNIRYSFDLRGNRVVYRSITDNPLRLFAITYGLIKKNGISKGNTLMPDMSRLAANIVPVSEDRYVLITDGIYEVAPQGDSGVQSESDQTKSNGYTQMVSESIKKRRPLMRLMSISDGRMIRLNKTRNTEGMMYGMRGYSTERSVAEPLCEGAYLAVEFSNGESSVVSTRNISNGKEYPEDGTKVFGKILGSDGKSITVGRMERDTGTLCIRKTNRYDPHMAIIPGTEETLHVPIQSKMGLWGYLASFPRISLVDYKFESKSLKKICFPRGRDTAWADDLGIDTYIPAIIPVSISEISDEAPSPCPLHPRIDLGNAIWCRVHVVLCTLFRGRICNEVGAELIIPSESDRSNPMDGVIETIEEYMYMLHTPDGFILVEQCWDKDLPEELWPYHAFSIGWGGSRTEISDSIVGPQSFLRGAESVLSETEGKIAYVRIRDDCYEHVLLGSDSIISVPGNNPYSLYRDERLSVTYQEGEDGSIIITDGRTTVRLDCSDPAQYTESHVDAKGSTHLISAKRYHTKEELYIPVGITGSEIRKPKLNPGEKVYNLGRRKLYYCQGLYGVVN